MPGPGRWAIAVGSVALILVLAGPPVGPARQAGAGLALREGIESLGGTANLSIVVDPASWWMESGTNSTFLATWVGTPAGCQTVPIWFRWAIAPGGSEGVLGSTNESRTTFFAADQGSGSTTLVVRSAASLRCPGDITAAFARSSAMITVAAPLATSGLAVEPDPVVLGAATDLVGSVTGGEPPYRLRVAWGDGNVTYSEVEGPGSFSVPHTYGANGSYLPQLLATDADGRAEDADPEEPAYVSSGFAAAIVPSTSVVEVGVPATFTVATVGAPRNFSWAFECQDATPAGSGNATGLAFGCVFDSAGVAPVIFVAVGSRSPFATVSATLDESVVNIPSLLFPVPLGPGEVGMPTYAPLDLLGGVPPFSVDWSLVGTGASGVQAVTADGVDYLPLDSTQAGTLVLSAVAVDSLGVATPAMSAQVAFVPPLEASAGAATALANGTVDLNVSGSAVGGAPPFDWAVVPGAPATNGSPDAGVLATSGGFAWNATYHAEGSLVIAASVVDSDGALVVVNLSVVLVPSLSLSAAATPAGPGRVTLNLTISGGTGPFAYRWNDSCGDVWSGTDRGTGSLTLLETPSASGPLIFAVVVVDGLGFSASSQSNATVEPVVLSRSSTTDAESAAAVIALFAVAGTGVMVFRRRRPSTMPAPPDPVAVLREVIEPSDGVDRGMVELLAEERGVPLEVVRCTLERLRASGVVRSGRGSDGEEVLAWSEPAAR